jgi:hypothetical protein
MRPFTVTWETVMQGSREQVFDAIIARCAAWIWEIDYEPRLGGAERGLTQAGGTVTAWEPGRRFETSAEGADGWFNRLSWELQPHADGGTRVAYRHESAAEAGDWQRIYDECVAHTDFYRHSLGQYVAHFAGREARYVGIETDAAGAAVRARLGLAQDAAAGDRVRLSIPGAPPVEGVVDYLTPAFLGVRGEDLLFRVYGRESWGDPSTVALHLFDPAADAAAAERAWKDLTTTIEAVA